MSEWGEISLGEGCEILDSLRVPLNADERDGIKGDVPYYGANGLQGYINKAIFNEPLILLAEDGGYFDEYETRPIAYRISGPSWVNNHAHILRVKKDGELDQNFTFYCLQHKNITPFIKGGTRAKLNQSELRGIVVPKPPPKTQRRIATILTTLDEVIEATEKLVEKHQQIKAGLMHDLFTRGLWTRPELARGDHKGLPCEATAKEGQLRPTPEEAPGLYQDSPLGLIPKAWKVVRLDRCVPESRPIVYGILMPGTGHEGGIPVIKVKDIRDERVDLSDILLTSPEIDQQYARAKTKAGDVLFTIRGSVGRVALVPEELDGANITQDTARISASGVDSIFLLGFLLSQSASKYAAVHTLGVAVQGINLGELRSMPIALPPPEEQAKIGNHLAAATAKIDTEKEHLAKLRQQKQGLMHDLLTGRVRME